MVRQDVQAAFLETPEQKALISAMGNMSLTMDPNAPKGLSDLSHEDQQAVECDQYLVAECERRSRMAEQIKKEYGSTAYKGAVAGVSLSRWMGSELDLKKKFNRPTRGRQKAKNLEEICLRRLRLCLYLLSASALRFRLRRGE